MTRKSLGERFGSLNKTYTSVQRINLTQFEFDRDENEQLSSVLNMFSGPFNLYNTDSNRSEENYWLSVTTFFESLLKSVPSALEKATDLQTFYQAIDRLVLTSGLVVDLQDALADAVSNSRISDTAEAYKKTLLAQSGDIDVSGGGRVSGRNQTRELMDEYSSMVHAVDSIECWMKGLNRIDEKPSMASVGDRLRAIRGLYTTKKDLRRAYRGRNPVGRAGLFGVFCQVPVGDVIGRMRRRAHNNGSGASANALTSLNLKT